MSIELKGTSSRCLFSILAWRKLLELAQQYGWEPAGEKAAYLNEASDPDGAMDLGRAAVLAVHAQMVSTPEAEGLAAAVEQALLHIPTYEVTTIKRRPLSGAPLLSALATRTGATMWSPDPESEPIEFFSGRLRQQLQGFIRLCRTGRFTITRCTLRTHQLVAELS